MNTGLRTQIYESLKLRETEDLLEIWKANDRVEWSDEAFNIIKEILTTRAVEIPPQNEPIYEKGEDEDDSHDRDGLEEWESKLVDREDQPEFYDALDVLDLHRKLNKTARIVAVVYVGLVILNFPGVLNVLAGEIPSWQELIKSVIPSAMSRIVSYSAQALISFYLLRSLASLLRILMEMEFNSRK